MAKTAKSTKKVSTKSVTKKNSSKKRLLTKVNFRSRKTQLILTVIVFALVGGTWFTYSSFAATEPTVVASYTGSNLIAHSDHTCSSGAEPKEDAQKSGSVWQVPTRACIKAAFKPSASVTDDYRVCITAKGSRAKFSAPSINSNVMPLHSPTKYTKFCTNSVRQTPGALAVKAPVVKIEGGNVRIGIVTLERMGAPAVNSAPAPAK